MISKDLFVKLLEGLRDAYDEVHELEMTFDNIYDGTAYNPLLDIVYDAIIELCKCNDEDVILVWYLFSNDSYKLECECWDVEYTGEPKSKTAADIYDYLYEKYMKEK